MIYCEVMPPPLVDLQGAFLHMGSLTGFLNVKNEKHGLLSGRPKPPAPPVFKECSLSSGIFPDGGEAVSLPLPVTDSTHIPWLLASSLLWSSSLHLVLTTTKRGSSPLNIQIIWNNLSFSRYTPKIAFFCCVK